MVNSSVINIELVEVINGDAVRSQQFNLNIIEYPENFTRSYGTCSCTKTHLVVGTQGKFSK
jgi:hypothetical protein